jgi:chromosome partitioning protein
MKIISMVSGKGGIGKTTSATNLGAGLAIMGKRVLMLDIDKQSHTTMQFNKYDPTVLSIGDVYMDRVHPFKAIQKTDIANLDIIPANYNQLDHAIKELTSDSIVGRLNGILELEYDFVIIDCPPDLGILTANALAISDYVLVPLTSDRWGTEGFSNIANKINEVRDIYNSKLKLLGVFVIKDDKSALNQKLKDQYKEVFQNLFFDTTIRASKLIGKSSFMYPVVIQYPKAKVSLDYKNFTSEVINKCSLNDLSIAGGF